MKRILICCIVFLIILAVSIPVAYTTTFNIATSGEWKSWNNPETDWNTLGFDDSGWRNAYEGYATHPDITLFPELAIAATIWDWPDSGVPDGSSGPVQAYFRQIVTLDGDVVSALFSNYVDDNMILYINGSIAKSNIAPTITPQSKDIISTALFNVGDNIIAIYAWDGYPWGPGNRGGESLTALLSIETDAASPVPEPGTMILLSIGLVGLAVINRKKYFKNL